MFSGAFEDDFPAVGGVKANKCIGKENDDKGFGGVAESRDQVVEEGFEDGNLLFAVDNQPGEGDD